MREYADWWNVAISALDRVDELRDQVGDVRVSIQRTVAVVPSEAERESITETTRRRWGGTVMSEHVALGTTSELIDHFGAQHERGIDRFYIWFTDFAPPGIDHPLRRGDRRVQLTARRPCEPTWSFRSRAIVHGSWSGPKWPMWS